MNVCAAHDAYAYHGGGCARAALDKAVASLAGGVIFKSHLHNGQRVATEYTMRPNATHLVLMQALMLTSIGNRNRLQCMSR